MFLYYKYMIRAQYLLKHPVILGNIIQLILKKILVEVFLDDLKSSYYIYLYNISLLIRILTNKFLYVKKVKKSFNINKVYMGVILKKGNIYQFIDIFTSILLPLFDSFNLYLDLNKFDFFGNLKYKLVYFDPVFMSKNAVTSWSPLYTVNIKICASINNKGLHISMLQYLKLKWYYIF